MSHDHFDTDADALIWERRAKDALSVILVLLFLLTYFMADLLGRATAGLT